MKILQILEEINLLSETTGQQYKLLPTITQKEEIDLLAVFGVDFPQDMLKLYKEFNGIDEYMKMAEAWVLIHHFVWSSTRVIEEYKNLMPQIQGKIFFADAGNGESFCIDRQSQSVFVWYPIENELRELAKTVDTFLEKWIVGEIKI